MSSPAENAGELPRHSRVTAHWWRRYSLFVVLLTPIALLAIANPVFRQPGNLYNLLQQSSIVGVLAIGQTIVIILGGFDLSVGAAAAVAGVICFLVFGASESPLIIPVAFAAALACCCAIGILNGLLIAKLRISSLIATLGMLSLARGFVLIVSDGQLVYAEGLGYKVSTALQGSIGGFPIAGAVFLGLAALVTIVLRVTVYGQYVYAIGGNERSAALAGIPVERVKIITYAACSALAGIGGILLAARTASALPNAGTNYELQAITAAVIGGAQLGGGKGSVPGTILGVLLLSVIANALNLYNVSPFWQTGVTGAVLLAAVGLSVLSGRKADGAR